MQKLLSLFISLILLQLTVVAQNKITISGLVKDSREKTPLTYVNIALKTARDSAFVLGTITNEEGRFTLADLKSGSYYAELTFVG